MHSSGRYSILNGHADDITWKFSPESGQVMRMSMRHYDVRL